jgi:hypothetical protein
MPHVCVYRISETRLVLQTLLISMAGCKVLWKKVEDAVSPYRVELPKVFPLRWCLLEYRIVEVGGGQHLNASLSQCDLGG